MRLLLWLDGQVMRDGGPPTTQHVPWLSERDTFVLGWDSRLRSWNEALAALFCSDDESVPLHLFMLNSEVSRAVSCSGCGPEGPYTFADTVFPPFHHNEALVGPTQEGYYLLFFVGAGNISGQADCTNGVPDVPPSSMNPPPESKGRITMAWTKDLVNGPWKQRVILRFDDSKVSNPGPVLLPNGTVVVVYRGIPGWHYYQHGLGEELWIATAQHWTGEFVRDPKPIERYNKSHPQMNEDPFMWVMSDGTWHILNHQQSAANVCGQVHESETQRMNEGHSCGAHWFAYNPHGKWHLSKEPAYTGNVTLVNGSKARFLTRQRPELVLAKDGTPLYLLNGASFDCDNNCAKITHTYVQRFRQRVI